MHAVMRDVSVQEQDSQTAHLGSGIIAGPGHPMVDFSFLPAASFAPSIAPSARVAGGAGHDANASDFRICWQAAR